MIIPHESLESATLDNMIEEFVTRDGTDYGEHEMSLTQKCQQVLARLHSGEVVILYIEATQSANIVERARLN